MDTSRLKYFCTIVETGSLTQAAEILNISHSGLSKAMTQLQTELGFSLFQAQGRGLQVTEEGLRIYEESQEILKSIHRLYLREEKVETVSIGLSEILALALSSEICQELSMLTRLLHAELGDVENGIRQKKLDFGIVFLPWPHPELDFLKLGATKMYAYATQELIDRWEPEGLQNIPFVTPASLYPDNPMSLKNRDGWPWDEPRSVAYQVDTFAQALTLLESHTAAVFAPDFMMKKWNALQRTSSPIQKVPVFEKVSVKREIFLLKPKNKEESAEMKKVAKVVRKALRS